MKLNFSIDWTELSVQWMLTCGHFLWQGVAVAIAFLLLEWIAAMFDLNRTETSQELSSSSAISARTKNLPSAATRYVLACVALLALPACAVLTFTWIHKTRGSFVNATSLLNENAVSLQESRSTIAPKVEQEIQADALGDVAIDPQTLMVARNQQAIVETAARRPSPVSQWTRFVAPVITATYAIGVSLLLLRMSVSLLGSLNLRISSQPVTDPQLLQVILTQARRLKLKAVPIVAICKRVTSPVVVGIVRPMILLPPSLLCGLDSIQLAAILSHEMAHIRRYDLMVNLAQRIIESVLFFHPVVWWLSRRVTIERESCCDDVAASFVGRLAYAEALLQMASVCLANQRSRSQALAMLAADGGNSTDFGYRVRRLIDAQETPNIRVTKRSLGFCLAIIALMGASYFSFAQNPQAKKDESTMSQPSKETLVDGIQWSTWGDRDGLLSGARLILPEGGVHPGQPVIVEYRLKNVSAETKKLTCFVRSNWQYITLGPQNRIHDMGIDTSDKSIEITIEPGKEYIATSHTATIDSHGLSPGDYQVALGTAFYCPDKDQSGVNHEIPHRGSIPLTILGAKENPSRPLDNGIHWGGAISGLRLGATYRSGTSNFAIGDIVEADLWIANVTNHAIKCSIRLPHPMDGWWFNIENDRGDPIMLDRPPMISSPLEQRFYEIELAPGEVKALTGDRIEGQPDRFAGRRAKFEIVGKKEDQSWGDYTIKGRLVTQGGNYSAIYNVVLERPDIPSLRIELNSGNYPFTVGQPFGPRAARALDDATDKSILWGERTGGLRLGIRQSELGRRNTVLRHGEHLDYEVWIKNETDEVVHIGRDPRDLHRPGTNGDRMINVIGSGMWMSFFLPQEELAKSELILPPGHAARRFLEPHHSASIRPPGSPRGRFGSDPLLLEPGKYTVFAQVGDLKSGVEEVEIIPGARLQIRKSASVTDKKREHAVTDPSEAILEWQTGNGTKQEALIHWDHGVFVDERDLASVEIVPIEGQSDSYSIALKLRPEATRWLSRCIASHSLWDDPNMVAILLDGKPLGAIHIPSPIPDDKLNIPVHFPRELAESTIKEIQAAMAAGQR